MSKQVVMGCLFGGVLFSAGIANGQEFILKDTSIFSFPRPANTSQNAYVVGEYDDLSLLDEGALGYLRVESYSAWGDNYSWSRYENNNYLAIGAGWLGNGTQGQGYTDSWSQIYFRVDQDAELHLSWDLSELGAFTSRGGFLLYEDTPTGFVGIASAVTDDPFPPADVGSMVVQLEAGVDYGLELAFQGARLRGMGNHVTARLVPAPASIGVLGLAGVAAARRRRTS